MSSGSIRVFANDMISFVLMTYYFIVYMYTLFTHSLADGHLGLHFLGVVNSAAIILAVQMCL